MLGAAGYTGSLRTVQRALREVRREWARQHHRVYRPWVSAPGHFLVVDWGEVGSVPTAAGERRLYCFCAVLGWSRWRYVRFFTCQRFQVLAQGLAGCFEAAGGVPAHVMFDNAKTITIAFVAGVSVLNPQLVRLATHYRFTPVTAAASDPESKGKVEALVRHLKANLPPERFGSLAEANRWAERWCEEVNADVHSETRETPADRLERERPLLRPLAERAAAAGGEVRKVDRMSTVRFGSARYSVPWELAGLQVDVLVEGDEVRVMRDGAEVALHRLQPPGGASIQDGHYPTPPPNRVRAVRPRHPTELAFLRLGPAAEAYLRAAAAAGTPRLHQQLAKVLQLAEVYEPESVQAALVRAREFGRFGWNDIRSILAAAGAAPPAKVEGAMPMAVSGLPQVPQREMTTYRWTT